jgi:hypothetical protein
MRQFISHTVFRPIGPDARPDKVLVVLFHRSAALLYLIYSLWGISSIFGSIPSIVQTQGDWVSIFFSALVTPISFVAFVGATYFPRFARLEMYTAASLVTLVTIYEFFEVLAFFQGNEHAGVSLVLNLSLLVIPISRVILIYIMLVKQAGDQ